LDENNENKKMTYRRSTRHLDKKFHKVGFESEDNDFQHQLSRKALTHDTDFDEESENERELPISRSSFFSNSFSHLQLLIFSVILSLTFYSCPFFNRVATGSAAVNLYAGFGMNHGVTPYNELFGSSGPLFYLVNQIGAATGSTLILWLCEIIVLWGSGVMAFDIIQEMLNKKSLSTVIAASTMLAIAGISLGGDQGIVFALPFALYGVRVLNRYFIDDKAVKDEVFILFGISGALASLFFPLFLVIWVIGALGLFGRNISLRNFGRGFYQLLAGVFGFLLVFSVAGYYTLTTQIFFPTIEQAVILPFTHLNVSASGAINLAISLLLVLLFGLLSSWFYGFYYAANGSHRIWSGVLLFVGILSLIFVSFMQSYSPAFALVILPFSFMFIGLHVDREMLRQRSSFGEALSKYIRAAAILPVLGLIFLVAYPVADTMLNSSYISSERAVAAYVKKQSTSSDQVTVLSNSLEINRLARRASDVTLPPSYYPASYNQAVSINISTAKSKYVVVDNKLDLSDSLKSMLSSNYKNVKFGDTHFKIYQIK
jgi:hypothetical protein